MKNLKFLPLMIILTSSCATIINGSKESIYVSVEPPNAKIFFDGKQVEGHEVSVKVKRAKTHQLIISSDGYQTKTVEMDRQFQVGYGIVDGVLALTGVGLIWGIVDACTGAWYDTDPNSIHISLEKNR